MRIYDRKPGRLINDGFEVPQTDRLPGRAGVVLLSALCNFPSLRFRVGLRMVNRNIFVRTDGRAILPSLVYKSPNSVAGVLPAGPHINEFAGFVIIKISSASVTVTKRGDMIFSRNHILPVSCPSLTGCAPQSTLCSRTCGVCRIVSFSAMAC